MLMDMENTVGQGYESVHETRQSFQMKTTPTDDGHIDAGAVTLQDCLGTRIVKVVNEMQMSEFFDGAVEDRCQAQAL